MVDIVNPSTPVGRTTSSGEAAGLMVSANGGNFTPSSVGSSSFTMDGTAQGEAIASGVTKLQVVNTGVTTEAIYVSFGTTQVAADTQLAIAAAAATNGYYLPSPVDAPTVSPIINVPAAYVGGFYAIANAVAGDVQDVIVSQGV